MSCIDREAARRLEVEGGPAWEDHLAACEGCRELRDLVRAAAGREPAGFHPSAAALTAYDEDPGGLSARARGWLERHLAACGACRAALRSVPLQRPPGGVRALPGPWPLAAAAGWLLAALLAGRGLLGPAPREGGDPLMRPRSLVLSTSRGPEAPRAPDDADLLRLELIVGEEVPLGARLHVRVEDETGAVVVDRPWTVEERSEMEHPILTVRAASLPPGRLRLVVRIPSGRAVTFPLAR